ncbi:MAG: prolipoprotein diacylglyceryl transferase [Eubacteriaceae bacterium]|nr:prolipoprotein diacylglyceryl transferase [Eubacteriaceae bacterium]
MHPQLFTIGPFTIYTYGLMTALGFVSAMLVGSWKAKKNGLDPDQVYNIVLVALIGGYAGSKLLFYITEIKSIIQNPKMLLDIGNGFVVYGGLISGSGSVYLYCKKKNLSFIKYADLLFPSVAMAQGIGRIGCHLAGCCYGKTTTLAIGIVFPQGSFAPPGIPLLPTQLISTLGDLAIAAILHTIYAKRTYYGQTTTFYLILYGVGRFAIEFLRDDPRGSVSFLTTSQFISIFFIVAGIAMLAMNKTLKKQMPAYPPQKLDQR